MQLVRHSGFDFLEISIDATPERLQRLTDKACILEIKRAIEQTCCPVYTMALTANRNYPLGSEDKGIREKGKSIVLEAIQFAVETGIRLIHLAAYDELGDKCNIRTAQLFVEELTACVDFAARNGVILALETMDAEFMDCGAKIMKLVRLLDSPYLQCYVDIGNLYASGIDILGDMSYARNHIVGIHLKDSKPDVYRDVLFGEGIVDFDYCFQVMNQIDYKGFLVAEMWSHDKEEFHPYLKEANLFIRNKMYNNVE